MAHKEIKTSIQIAATPEIVWNVLTNFKEYETWNPFIASVEGEVAEGNIISINAGGMKFKPTVLVYKENKELRWLGKLLFKGIFDGEHSFQIEDNKDGTVTLYHEEQFNGLLVGVFANKLEKETKNGFEQMNEQLKKLAEAV